MFSIELGKIYWIFLISSVCELFSNSLRVNFFRVATSEVKGNFSWQWDLFGTCTYRYATFMYTPRTQQKFRSVCNGKDFLLFPGPSKIRNVENYKAYSVRFIFKNSNFSHSPPSPNAVQRLVRLAAAYKTISLFTVYIDMFCTRFGQSDHLAKCQSPGQLIPRS